MAKLKKMDEDGHLESFLRQIDELKQKEPHEIELCIQTVLGTISFEVFSNLFAPNNHRIRAKSRLEDVKQVFDAIVARDAIHADKELERLVVASHELIKQACRFLLWGVSNIKLTQMKMQLNPANHALVAYVFPTFGMIVQQAIDEAPAPPPARPAPHNEALPPPAPEEARIIHVGRGASATRSSANEAGRLVIAVTGSSQSPANAAPTAGSEDGRLVSAPGSNQIPANAATMTRFSANEEDRLVAVPRSTQSPAYAAATTTAASRRDLDALFPLEGHKYQAARQRLGSKKLEKLDKAEKELEASTPGSAAFHSHLRAVRRILYPDYKEELSHSSNRALSEKKKSGAASVSTVGSPNVGGELVTVRESGRERITVARS
jgi:hypothetical protein